MSPYQFVLFVVIYLSRHSGTSGSIAKPGCPDKCGNVTIIYPFGIDLSCSLDPSFNIFCDDNLDPQRPYLRLGLLDYSLEAEILNISDTQVRVKSAPITSRCYDQYGELTDNDNTFSIDFSLSSFSLSADDNRLILIGCENYISRFTSAGDCTNTCAGVEEVKQGCSPYSAHGCCLSSIPNGLKTTTPYPSKSGNTNSFLAFSPCSYAFVGDPASFTFPGASDLSDPTFANRTVDSFSIVLDWQISNQTCREVKKINQSACHDNSHCVNSDADAGYRCACNTGYAGNPYLSPGCQDIDECAYDRDNDNYPCVGICSNIEGSYNCICPKGFFGNGKKNGTACTKKPKEVPMVKISLGSGLGALTLLISIALLYYTLKKRKLLQLRQKFFEKNGGSLLQQRLSSSAKDDVVSAKIFTMDELERATDNFSQKYILGQGGSGTVYKGNLHDKRAVAIKKSKFIDNTQIEVFINEVIILTQINHKNVVKLLGCCLETEAPLLVYEYISKGTLQQHIDQHQENTWFSWDNRLRVAIDAAGALNYLHSSTHNPVIHRDVKSTNILLDDYYTPKISDFGASRLVPLNQTIVVNTLVQGTLGYLDPEYFQTGNLTGKSDVYSFGVVLAELITGKRALSPIAEEGSLANLMINSVKEKLLFRILDERVLKEGSFEQLHGIANLIVRCLHLKGEERPSMREVALELERIRRLVKTQWAEHETLEGSVDQTNEEQDLYEILPIE